MAYYKGLRERAVALLDAMDVDPDKFEKEMIIDFAKGELRDDDETEQGD